jgi:beta-glucosidase
MEEYKYSEGLFIGQRWFDLKRIKPIFNFGYGLSYTKFTFKNLNAEMKESGLFVNVTVINEGNVDGSSVVLIFLTFPNYVSNFPIRVFKGFEKVFVKKGESVICHIFVDDFSLSYYSVEVNDFVRPKKGEFVVFAGSSAGIEDLKLSVKVKADF